MCLSTIKASPVRNDLGLVVYLVISVIVITRTSFSLLRLPTNHFSLRTYTPILSLTMSFHITWVSLLQRSLLIDQCSQRTFHRAFSLLDLHNWQQRQQTDHGSSRHAQRQLIHPSTCSLNHYCQLSSLRVLAGEWIHGNVAWLPCYY